MLVKKDPKIFRISTALKEGGMKANLSRQNWYGHIEQTVTLADVRVCKIATFQQQKRANEMLL